MEKLIRFFKDEEGVTAIEYGLIAAFIAIAIIVFLPGISDALKSVFSKIQSALEGATESTAA
ncbi:MAG: Flp family type IVb pilin [Syntrophobacterales bacterium CG_4_8_14_3_um_filter_49_14]|nr:MAG: Flp family type IVb pilin [Syntrophobacterales bacterium CG_4_8_14_3_um_filter_49_14]